MSIDMENKNNRKAIQILRGSNDKIVNSTDKLLDGQLLYNKDKNYLTVGSNSGDYKLNAQPIRVRELGGFSSDDRGIASQTDSTGFDFSIKHEDSSLDIWDSKHIIIGTCPAYNNLGTSKSSSYLKLNFENPAENSSAVIDTYNNKLEMDNSHTLLMYRGNLVELGTAIVTIKSTGALNLNSVSGITSNSKLEVNDTISGTTISGTTITASNWFAGQLGVGAERADIYCKDINASGQIQAAGQITADSFNATSDARLKTNIKPLTYHDSILDIPVCEYDWKESGKHAIGFIAQELKEVYPELVDENEEGILSIKETKLVYLLIEEVKKLKEEIQELKR